MRRFGARGSTWWYDSRGGWDDWGGWDSGDESGIRVLSLRRALNNCIISISKQISADIDCEGAAGEGGCCLIGSG